MPKVKRTRVVRRVRRPGTWAFPSWSVFTLMELVHCQCAKRLRISLRACQNDSHIEDMGFRSVRRGSRIGDRQCRGTDWEGM